MVAVGCAQGLVLGGEADAEPSWAEWAHAPASVMVRRPSRTDEAREIPLFDMEFLPSAQRNSRVWGNIEGPHQ
jgi:hypothetical protein